MRGPGQNSEVGFQVWNLSKDEFVKHFVIENYNILPQIETLEQSSNGLQNIKYILLVMLLWIEDTAYVEWSHSAQSHILNQLG